MDNPLQALNNLMDALHSSLLPKNVEVTEDNMAEQLAPFIVAAKKVCLVGIPEDKNSRKDEMSNATLASIHEHGSPIRNLPARPFLTNGIKDSLPQITQIVKRSLTAKKFEPLKALKQMGSVASVAAKKQITGGKLAPLSEAYKILKYKKKKGNADMDKPLIFTGQLLRSITYEIKDLKDVAKK